MKCWNYKGKHFAAKNMRLPTCWVACMAALAVVALLAGVQTLALLTQNTAQITNPFHPVQTELTVDEIFDGTVKRDVTVQNTGEVALYFRVQLLPQAQDTAGNVLAYPVLMQNAQAGGNSTAQQNDNYRAITLQDFTLAPMGDAAGFTAPEALTSTGEWLQIGNYYYYTALVQPGQHIPLFASAALATDCTLVAGAAPVLSILADGVQANAILLGGAGAAGTQMPANPWPDVRITTNGTLAPAAE